MPVKRELGIQMIRARDRRDVWHPMARHRLVEE